MTTDIQDTPTRLRKFKPKTCLECRTPFVPTSGSALYCGPCRINVHRDRQRLRYQAHREAELADEGPVLPHRQGGPRPYLYFEGPARLSPYKRQLAEVRARIAANRAKATAAAQEAEKDAQ